MIDYNKEYKHFLLVLGPTFLMDQEKKSNVSIFCFLFIVIVIITFTIKSCVFNLNKDY